MKMSLVTAQLGMNVWTVPAPGDSVCVLSEGILAGNISGSPNVYTWMKLESGESTTLTTSATDYPVGFSNNRAYFLNQEGQLSSYTVNSSTPDWTIKTHQESAEGTRGPSVVADSTHVYVTDSPEGDTSKRRILVLDAKTGKVTGESGPLNSKTALPFGLSQGTLVVKDYAKATTSGYRK